jgi:hypothetical protein
VLTLVCSDIHDDLDVSVSLKEALDRLLAGETDYGLFGLMVGS